MTQPAINTAGQTLYDQVEPIVDGDSARGWAALYLCSAIGALMQQADQVVQDSDVNPGWTLALDADTAPAGWLPWLAWLYGVTLVPNSAVQAQRDTIRDLPPHQRGTRASLIAAAAQHLTGNKTVGFIERNGSAYALTVITRASETPDSAAVLAALLEQKPAGIILTYTTATAEVWDEAVNTWNTVDGTVTWDAALTTGTTI